MVRNLTFKSHYSNFIKTTSRCTCGVHENWPMPSAFWLVFHFITLKLISQFCAATANQMQEKSIWIKKTIKVISILLSSAHLDWRQTSPSPWLNLNSNTSSPWLNQMSNKPNPSLNRSSNTLSSWLNQSPDASSSWLNQSNNASSSWLNQSSNAQLLTKQEP